MPFSFFKILQKLLAGKDLDPLAKSEQQSDSLVRHGKLAKPFP